MMNLISVVNKARWMLAGLLFVALLVSCSGREQVSISGRTMGTTYQVQVVADRGKIPPDLKATIDRRLDAINQSMSTYRPDSEISRFNVAGVDEPVPVSGDFITVLKTAGRLNRLTDGAWDGTLDPLINLWGFGRKGVRNTVPDPDAIAECLDAVGMGYIDILPGNRLVKRRAGLTLDLASIAKGYGVDAVADVLRQQGFTDFLVEIGGEVVAAGRRPDGNPWRVGINRPDPAAARDAVYAAIDLADRAMATSGDYRNFFEMDGRRYSHVIDPRTGYPVSNGVVSASVIADSCVFADGLATAVMVMGLDNGLALVNRLPGVECLIVVASPDGSLTDHFSTGFDQG